MSNWLATNESDSIIIRYSTLVIFCIAAASALILFVAFKPMIEDITTETPVIVNIMFIPTLIIGFLYGLKITERVMQPSEARSPLKRGIVKLFLFFFIIGGLFSSVNFALHGGALMPETSPIDDGLLIWATDMITSNGGTTFLIASSFTLMAAATRRIVGLNAGLLSRIITFAGTFIFFSMISMSITQSDPTHSQIYLYTFYHAGIIGGAMYQMNRFTTNLNKWEDYMNDQ